MNDNKTYKVIVWGSGSVYNSHLFRLRHMEAEEGIEVIGIYSNSLVYGRYLDGYPILSRQDVQTLQHDYLFLMSDKYEADIIQDYIILGGDRRKVVPSRVLDIPYLTFSRYLQIRNSRFSIFSETCYAGILYYRLGLEVLSPLKDMWMTPEDYFRLLDHLDYYMSFSPVLSHMEGVNSAYDSPNHPVLRLDDIYLHYNHTDDPDQAIKAWDTRKQRINYNNILVTFFAQDPNLEDAFYKAKKYQRRICFTAFPSVREDSVFIPKEHGSMYISEFHWTARPYGNLLDIYSLFYGDVRYRRSLTEH